MKPDRRLDAVDRRAVLLIAASSLLLVLEGGIILAGASPGFPGNPNAPRSGTVQAAFTTAPDAEAPGMLLSSRAALELENLRSMTLEEAAAAAWRWAREISSKRPLTEADAAEILPEAAFFLARTASLSEVWEIRTAAEGSDAFARAYKPINQAMRGSNAAGARVEAVLDVVYRFLAPADAPAAGESRLCAPLARNERWIASREHLRHTHQNALDIFFYFKSLRNSAQKGPVIRSMSPGLVVAASDDWSGGRGGDREYRRGGLTPRAGNGVIVYDPGTGRYYSYFHLYDLRVRPGQLVEAGTPLGYGGNTGTNARMRDHGGHLHLEIFDAGANDTLDCYRLRDLILSL